MATGTEFWELLSQPFVQEALSAAVLAGLVSGYLGPFLVWRRLGQLGNAVSHAALTPIAIAQILGWPFQVLLYPFSILVSILLARLEERKVDDLDTILSVFFSGMMGVGGLILAFSGQGSADAVHLLFGDILLVARNDLLSLGVVALLTVGFIHFNRKKILLAVLNPELAEIEGIPVKRLSYALMILCGLTVAAALKLMGVVLVTSLLLIPALIANQLSRGLNSHILLSTVLGVALSVTGFLLSLALDLPSGATIAAVGLTAFVLLRSLPRMA